MGLATVIRKEKAKEGLLRLLVLGLDGAGKSSVVTRWCGGDVNDVREIAPTAGFRILTTRERLHIWDVGGQTGIRHYWRNYFEATDGLVFVIDAAAPSRLKESFDELVRLLGSDADGSGNGVGRLHSFSVLILANKNDCDNAMEVIEIKTMLEPLFASLSGDIHWRVFSTSALKGSTMDESLTWLVDDIDGRLGFRKT